jgi:hypothetical protein
MRGIAGVGVGIGETMWDLYWWKGMELEGGESRLGMNVCGSTFNRLLDPALAEDGQD